MKTITCFLFIVSLAICSYGQNKRASFISSEKQVTINHSKPTVYIDFEKMGIEEPLFASDAKEVAWLKLTNNSKWSIYLAVFEYSSKKTGLYHYIEKENENSFNIEMPQGYVRGDLGSPDSELSPGKSIIFSVPRNHLEDNLKIRIDFTYGWERDINLNNSIYSNPRHSVYFSSSDLKRFLSK